jgi:hypothetical protein
MDHDRTDKDEVIRSRAGGGLSEDQDPENTRNAPTASTEPTDDPCRSAGKQCQDPWRPVLLSRQVREMRLPARAAERERLENSQFSRVAESALPVPVDEVRCDIGARSISAATGPVGDGGRSRLGKGQGCRYRHQVEVPAAALQQGSVRSARAWGEPSTVPRLDACLPG